MVKVGNAAFTTGVLCHERNQDYVMLLESDTQLTSVLVQVTLVINYDVPVEKDWTTPAYETYLHRIGRSGRFGRKGAAFNLVSGEQVRRLTTCVKLRSCMAQCASVRCTWIVVHVLQEKRILDSISEYFKHDIPEVPFNDEDEFLEVLKQAGLTDG